MRWGWLLVPGILVFVAQGFASVVIPVPITIPGTGYISAALMDANGVLVRTLAYAEPVGAGTKTFFWDGTTDLGLPALPGNYTTRAVFFTNAPQTRYVLKAGTSGDPPWRLKDGRGDWGGDLGGPSTIAANSSSLVIAWSAVENHRFLSGLRQIDTNGNVLYTYQTFYPYDGRMAGAMDETNLYLGILNRSALRIEIARFELGTSNRWILTNLPTPAHYTLSGRWKNRWQAMLNGMALTSDRIFASMALDNRLFILNRATGAILHQIDLPSPRGLAVSGNRLLLVTSNAVLKLTFDGVVESTLVSGAPLSDPYAITVDASGNVYVSDGASQRIDPDAISGNRQVHVFSPTGAYLRSIGAAGGSPRSGFINRHGFGDIRSVCIGPDRKLWVNEEITGFKRTSRWTTNGVLEREWFQRKLTHFADLINPARPNELIYPANAYEDYPALTAYTIDWATGTWAPAWSYAQTDAEMYQEEIYLSNEHSHALQQYQPGKRRPVFHYSPTELVTFNGRNYFLNHSGNGDGALFTYTETNAPRPVALVGYHRVDIITNKVVSYYDIGPNRWFTWADTDGDARMAMNEFTFTTGSAKLELSKRVWEAKLETNLNIRLTRAVGSNALMESILPVKQLLPNGVPVYDWAMLQDLAPRQMPKFEGGDGWKKVTRVNDEWVPVSNGDVEYTLVDPNTSASLNLPSLDHFWADRNWRKRIVKFESSTGKFLWAAGRRAPARAINGEMYNPYGISVSHGAVFAADVLGVVWLWSTDGLYLGRLMHDAEPGRTWDEYAVHAEIQGPVTLFTNEATARLYMIVNDTGAHAYEITLPTLQTLSANSVNLSAAMSAQAQPWDPDERIPKAGSELTVQRSGTNVVLSWHINAASMALQSAASPSGPWATITPARTTNGAAISVTLPSSTTRQFYRLMQ